MILAEVAVDDQRSRFHQRIFDIIYTELRCSCISQSLEYLVLKEFLPDSPDPVLRWYYADSPLERQRVSGHQERIDGSSLTKNAKKKWHQRVIVTQRAASSRKRDVFQYE